MNKGAEIIARERQRQIDEEGYSPEHDRGHFNDLAMAAAAYATPEHRRTMANRRYTEPQARQVPVGWPWDDHAWKPVPNNRIRELAKAGALIAAAIDTMIDDGLVTQVEGQTAMDLE